MVDFSREINLIGQEKFEKIANSKVAVFGVGGVGGYVVEALVRMGVGEISIFDNDVISPSNVNRQIIANVNTIGKDKVSVCKERCLLINPNCKINEYKTFVGKDNVNELALDSYNYVFDAIDTITSKVALIKKCKELGVQIISCMGTGNKLNPNTFVVEDIYKTSVCPLAKVMRKLLKDEGITSLKVVYSKEQPVKVGERIPASISFVPPVAGFLMVSEFFNYIIL